MVQDGSYHDDSKVLFSAGLTPDSPLIFMPAGPLPEPVINGGIEEKVSITV